MKSTVDKFTKKRTNIRKLRNNMENKEKTIKYTLSWKARVVLYGAVIGTMILAPFAYIGTMVVLAIVALWETFIVMPLNTKTDIMERYIAKGIAKPQIDVTEEV